MRELYAEARDGKRYSADSDDPGYKNYMEARNLGCVVWVYVDGVKLDKCVTADEQEGLAVTYPDPMRVEDGELVRITMRGQVRTSLVPVANA